MSLKRQPRLGENLASLSRCYGASDCVLYRACAWCVCARMKMEFRFRHRLDNLKGKSPSWCSLA